MSNDLLITPASRKIEFKDSSANVDAKIETDANGNLIITNAGGDITIGDTTSDIFVGDGTANVDIVFEQSGEIRGLTGVTVTLGQSDSTIRMGTDLNLNSNDITNAAAITSSGVVTASGGNSTNWNTAHGWGNHASAGYITGNQTITLSGDVSGSGTTSISVTIADDSHNHVISNVDGLQTALDAKLTSSSGLNATNLTSGTVPAARLAHNSFYLGATTAETGRTVKETGIYNYNVNNNTLGTGTITSYYSVMAWGNGVGGSAQLASNWTSSGNKLYFRSLRDTIDNWWDWKEIYHTGHKPTYSELGTMAYSNLTGTPTIPSLSGYATESYVGTQISNLVDSSPAALNTLNELAAALGDDANFSTTVNASIAAKLPLAGGTLTGNLTIGSTTDSTKIVFPDKNILDNPTAASHDRQLISMGNSGAGGLFQTTGRGGLMLASADDSVIIASGDVGRNYDPDAGGYHPDADNEEIYLLTDGGVRFMTNLQTAASYKQFIFDNSGNATIPGNIIVSGTVDGVDIASRNSVLTSTTTTANAALPKAGGTMTGTLAMGANAITSTGTITSGAITSSGHIQSAGALKVTETGTAQVIMIGNQDSGGTNKPAMIMGVNGGIRIGHGSSWSGEGGTFTEKITISGSDLKITSGGLILNATTVIDSSRNLTNIGTISSGAITSTGAIDGTKISVDSGTGNGLRVHSNSGITASNNYMNFFTSQTNGWSFNANGTGADSSSVFTISPTGTISSGQITATTTADATPALIATNSGGVGSVIARFIGDTDGLEIQCGQGGNSGAGTGDYALLNTQQDNGLVFFDGTGGVDMLYNGTVVQSWDNSGGTKLISGTLQIPTKIEHSGDTDTYLQFDADRVRLFAGGTAKFDSNNTYLTGNQTITLSGDVSGSGTTSISVTVADDSHFHHRLDSTDDRDMKPNTSGIATSVQALKPFFSSYGGMTGTANTTYVDVLAFDTYSDASGGGPSAITFKKGNSAGNPEMHIWKAGWNATTWSTGQRVYADNYHPNADILTNARTIAGTSFNGSADIDISYNNLTNQPTIPSISGLAPIDNPTFTGEVNIPNKLRHVGDTNTYIQFHAADQFRVVTGGSQRFEVNNTGIETVGRLTNTYTGTSAHTLKNATSNGTVLTLTSTADNRVLSLQTDHIFSNGSMVYGDNSYSSTYRGSVHNFEGGNVGIGVTSPTTKLHVDAPSTTAVSLTGGAAAGQIFTNEDFEFAFGLHNASPYPLYIQGRSSSTSTTSARDLVLNPLGGKIGIGTITPLAKLHVQGNAVIGNVLDYETTHPGESGATLHVHNLADDGADTDGKVNFGDETRVIISTGAIDGGPQGYQGSLWFGTSDHPAGGSTVNGSGTQFNWTVAGIASKTDQDTGGQNTSYGNLEFYTKGLNNTPNAALAMTIDESQRVGIGTNSPTFKLDVAGTGRYTADLYAENDVYIGGKLRHNGDVDNYIGFGTDIQSFVTGNSTRAQFSNTLVRFNQEGLNQDFQVFGQNDDNLFYADASTDRIGIGTTAPSEKLHIHSGGVYSTPISYAANADDWALKIGASNNAGWDFAGIKLIVNSSGTPRMSLMGPGANEAISIVSSNVGIGVIAPTQKLHVNGTTLLDGDLTFADNHDIINVRHVRLDAGAGNAIKFWDSTSYQITMANSSSTNYGRVAGETTSDYNMYFKMSGGTNRGFVFQNGNSGNNVAGIDASGNARFKADVVAYTSSDKRLKDNITPISNPMEKINKLSGNTFKWNDNQDTYEKGMKDVGVIAQEVEEVLPEIVETRDNGYKAVKYEKMVALLIEGMKEQQKQINELTKQVQELKEE